GWLGVGAGKKATDAQRLGAGRDILVLLAFRPVPPGGAAGAGAPYHPARSASLVRLGRPPPANRGRMGICDLVRPPGAALGRLMGVDRLAVCAVSGVGAARVARRLRILCRIAPGSARRFVRNPGAAALAQAS